MAKKVVKVVKLQIAAGKANPAPPVGPALGQAGVNIPGFCSQFNEKTKDKMGYTLPVVISVYEDRSFTFVVKTPPASDLLLKSILLDFKEVNQNFFNKIKLADLTQYDVKINPEYSVFLGNKRRDIDIVIEFYDEDKTEPIYSLCIENKITDNSIQKNDNQLKEELEGLQKEYHENEWKTEIYFCFLTLEDSNKSEQEFNTFNYEKKIHLFWKGEKSIQRKVLQILDQERIGKIDPISEDSKFLIKSFLAFIKTDFKSALEEKSDREERKNYGKPTREHFIDFIQAYEFNKDYEKSEIRKSFTKYIKDKCNEDINQSQLSCLLYEITVNEKNRIHYNVKEDNCESRNILYYPDMANKKIVRRYSKDLKDIEVFTK